MFFLYSQKTSTVLKKEIKKKNQQAYSTPIISQAKRSRNIMNSKAAPAPKSSINCYCCFGTISERFETAFSLLRISKSRRLRFTTLCWSAVDPTPHKRVLDNQIHLSVISTQPVCWTWMTLLSSAYNQIVEEEMATHTSILAGESPWIEEPGGLQSTGPKELDTT